MKRKILKKPVGTYKAKAASGQGVVSRDPEVVTERILDAAQQEFMRRRLVARGRKSLEAEDKVHIPAPVQSALRTPDRRRRRVLCPARGSDAYGGARQRR